MWGKVILIAGVLTVMQGDMTKPFELTVESTQGYSTARKEGSSTPCWWMLGLADTSQVRVLDRMHEGNTNPLFADTRSRGQQP